MRLYNICVLAFLCIMCVCARARLYNISVWACRCVLHVFMFLSIIHLSVYKICSGAISYRIFYLKFESHLKLLHCSYKRQLIFKIMSWCSWNLCCKQESKFFARYFDPWEKYLPLNISEICNLWFFFPQTKISPQVYFLYIRDI